MWASEKLHLLDKSKAIRRSIKRSAVFFTFSVHLFRRDKQSGTRNIGNLGQFTKELNFKTSILNLLIPQWFPTSEEILSKSQYTELTHNFQEIFLEHLWIFFRAQVYLLSMGFVLEKFYSVATGDQKRLFWAPSKCLYGGVWEGKFEKNYLTDGANELYQLGCHRCPQTLTPETVLDLHRPTGQGLRNNRVPLSMLPPDRSQRHSSGHSFDGLFPQNH